MKVKHEIRLDTGTIIRFEPGTRAKLTIKHLSGHEITVTLSYDEVAALRGVL